MEWLRIAMVLLVISRAIYTDMKKGIIENRTMLTGLIAGSVWMAFYKGTEGLIDSCKMILIILAMLFLLFLMKGLGAGDVKLFCVLAAFYPENVIEMVVLAFIVAAAIVWMRMLYRFIQKVPIWISQETMNFSIPIGISTVMVMVYQAI